MSGAIKGMLNELDPHSAYMPPDMFDEMQIETMGEFNGLGVEITVKDHLITIIAPIADTPLTVPEYAPVILSSKLMAFSPRRCR